RSRSRLLQSTRFQAGIGLMKHLQLIVLLTIGAASTSLAQSEKKVAPSQTSVERQLIELERQLSDALVKEDAAVLDRLWSNDLIFTFPNGKVSSKAERLAGQKPSAHPSQSPTLSALATVFL